MQFAKICLKLFINVMEGRGHHLIKSVFTNQDVTTYHPLAVIFENKLFNHVDISKDAGPSSFLNTFPTILPLCHCMKQSTYEKKVIH